METKEQSAQVALATEGLSSAQTRRRSDRISLELPIDVGGSDAQGVDFFESGKTIVVSRHGAKILFHRALSPNQEVTILCKTTGKEAAARVVGQIQKAASGYHYGIAFLEDGGNPWDIEFPELTESEHAAARVLLECAACRIRKVAYLDASEAEVFEANRRLSLRCARCGDATIWRPALVSVRGPTEPQVASAEAEPARPLRTRDERQEFRVRLRMAVCLRHAQLGEEIAETADISRGGFGFVSRKYYDAGTLMEAAVPYLPNQGNIFCPIRVVHCEKTPEGLFACGAAYIRP
jgi:hypothetical protein